MMLTRTSRPVEITEADARRRLVQVYTILLELATKRREERQTVPPQPEQSQASSTDERFEPTCP